MGAEHVRRDNGAGRRRLVLVVDDNPATRRFVRETLVLEGYQVTEAESGAAAIRACARQTPDLVLIDLCMGDMRGTDLIRWLRAERATADVPVVVFTGAPEEAEVCDATAHFSDLLTKPVDADVLVEAVRTHLAPAPTPPRLHRPGPRVLLVDAAPARCIRVRLQLRRLGFEVTTAATASQALRSARAFRPDLVVAELVLPDTTALDLTRLLHSDPRTGGVPVVLMSDTAWSPAQQRLAQRAGVAATVTLGSDPAALRDAVLAAADRPVRPPAAKGDHDAEAETAPDEHLLLDLHDEYRRQAETPRAGARARAELAILHGLAEALSDTADLDDVLRESLARCLHAIGASRGAVFVKEIDGAFSMRAHLGNLHRLPGVGLPASDELFHRVSSRGETMVIDGVTGVTSLDGSETPEGRRTASTIIAPLAAGPECFGVLAVEVPAHEDLAYWLHFLKLVGLALGFAVANVRHAPVGRHGDAAGRVKDDGTDELTGLPGASHLEEALASVLADPSARGALIVVDVDRIRHVNDTLGHHTGDELLRGVARSLQAVAGPGTTLTRLHGDVFALLAPLDGVDDGGALARQVLGTFDAPIRCNGYTLYATASVGVALFPDHARRPAALLQHATTALDLAKERGGNAFEVYSEHRGNRLWQRLTVDQGLRAALERDQFALHYQPIVDLGSGEVHAAEALLRWDRPFHGMTAAASFIEVAEETGLIVPIGAWVVKSAFHQAGAWADAGLGLRRVAVNVGAREFHQGHVYDTVSRAVHEYGVDPERVSLEITERVALADIDRAVATLRQLRELGIHTAIDDFGTGYSSLRYVHELPIDTLKIDRSFVANAVRPAPKASPAEGPPRGESILASIVDLAHRLDMTVVAEGIETERCLDVVRRLGCDMAQGYLLGRPGPADEFETLLAAS